MMGFSLHFADSAGVALDRLGQLLVLIAEIPVHPFLFGQLGHQFLDIGLLALQFLLFLRRPNSRGSLHLTLELQQDPFLHLVLVLNFSLTAFLLHFEFMYFLHKSRNEIIIGLFLLQLLYFVFQLFELFFKLAVPSLDILVLMFNLLAENKLLTIDAGRGRHSFEFISGHLLLLQKLYFFAKLSLGLGTEDLETALKVVEFDG